MSTPRTDEQSFLTWREGESVVDSDFARILERDYNRVLKEQRESYEHYKEAQQQFRDGTWHGNTTSDYRSSVLIAPDEHTALLSLEYQWQDKKHRHVHDLCDWIDKLQDENNELRELVNLITKQEMSDSGNLFYPTSISSCRCMDLEKIGQITEKYRSKPHISTEEYRGE